MISPLISPLISHWKSRRINHLTLMTAGENIDVEGDLHQDQDRDHREGVGHTTEGDHQVVRTREGRSTRVEEEKSI